MVTAGHHSLELRVPPPEGGLGLSGPHTLSPRSESLIPVSSERHAHRARPPGGSHHPPPDAPPGHCPLCWKSTADPHMRVLTPPVLGEAAHDVVDSGVGDSLSPHSARTEASGCREAARVRPSLWGAVPAFGCGRQAGRAPWDPRCSYKSLSVLRAPAQTAVMPQ